MKRLVALALVVASCSGGGDRVIVGAGTTLVDSGFIDALAAEYERATSHDISVLGESSQRLFDLARRGEADIVITHEPGGLEALIAGGNVDSTSDFVQSAFLLVGPPSASFADTGAAAVFDEIATRGLPFISRGDGSGTYLQELAFWALAGVDPQGAPWYEITGQGMGLTLQVADQRRAFVVVEDGVWLQARSTLGLAVVPLDGDWPNVYSITVMAGEHRDQARRFAEWVLSPTGAAAIETVNDELFGEQVYRIVTG